MILTKNYFKKFQYMLVLVCVLAAAFIGSIQTALIIFKCKGKKNHG
jgi:glycerol-3-phosphate acyltransferase PlsY